MIEREYGPDRKFLDEIVDLRRELYSEEFEYLEPLRSTEADSETIAKLEKEFQELQEKLYERSPGKA